LANVSLPALALAAVILIVTVVIGLYIVTQVESSMDLSGSNWYTPYNNFVSSMKTSFTLLGISVLVIIAAFILGTLIKLFTPTSTGIGA